MLQICKPHAFGADGSKHSHRVKTAFDIIKAAEQSADSALLKTKKELKVIDAKIFTGAGESHVLKRISHNDEVYYVVGENEINTESLQHKKSCENVKAESNKISNDYVSIKVVKNEIEIKINGEIINQKGYPRTGINYVGKVYYSQAEKIETGLCGEDIAYLQLSGKIEIDAQKFLCWRHKYLVAGNEPYVYAEVEIDYPDTEHKGYGPALAKKLAQTWDARYKEVMPFELCPNVFGEYDDELNVIKHNFFECLSSYKLEYYRFSKNRNLDSFNNHITNSFVGIGNNAKSVYLAQLNSLDNNFAFCPMRLRMDKDTQTLYMNPFGTYYGKQYKYQTGQTGLGRKLSLGLSDHLDTYAPSYSGKKTHFMLMIAACSSKMPNEKLVEDMKAFSKCNINI